MKNVSSVLLKAYIEKYPIYTQLTIQVRDNNSSVKPINKHSGTKTFRHDGRDV